MNLETRIANFKKLGLGLFIHWGYYSLFDKGEWYWEMYHLDKNKYYQEIEKINDLNINFEQMICNAKKWGFKYAVLTTRHHDGLSLYDTKGLSNYDINLRKDKRDFVKEFVDACHHHGIKPHLYHTTLDWLNPDFKNNFDSYLSYLNKSIEVLCKNYGEINGFWFDGNWSRKDMDWQEDKLYKLIRAYQPDAIIANNSGMANRGKLGNDELDVMTYEQGKLDCSEVSLARPKVKEVCQTFNDHWGIATNDYNHKSFGEILQRYVKCRHYNANLLLNVGPSANGVIPKCDETVLNMLGEWLNKYGFMMYQGKVTSLFCNGKENENNDFIVEDKGKTYLFLYNIKSGGHVNAVEYGGAQLPARVYENFTGKIKRIVALDDDSTVDFIQNNGILEIHPVAFQYGYNTIIRAYQIEIEK